jgi:ATP-dependent Clp protease ATP-binding subunit ClpA
MIDFKSVSRFRALLATFVMVVSAEYIRADLTALAASKISMTQPQDRSRIPLDRFSEEAIRVVFFARREVAERPRLAIEPEHLLLGVLDSEPVLVTGHLASDWSIDRLRKELTGPTRSNLEEDVELPFTPGAETVLQRAAFEADRSGSSLVRPAHVLLALLDESQAVSKLLHAAGVTREAVAASLK